MKKTKVTLIVLNFNGLPLLKEYFASVFNQTLLPDEIILLDNGSTDDSIGCVKTHFPTVSVIKNKFNVGTALGSNIAFDKSSGDYIIFQSNDIRMDRRCIEGLVKTLESDSHIGICTSIALYNDPNKQRRQIVENAGGTIDVYGLGWPLYNGRPLKTLPTIEEIFLSYGHSFIIRRPLFQLVSGFDEKFFTLNDDIDLSWRVRLLGYKIVYSRHSYCYHKGHGTLGPLFKRAQKRYWSERNCLRTTLKNYSVASLVRYLPGYLSLLTLEMFYYLYRRRFDLFLAIIKAIMWNVMYLPSTLKARNFIQKIRKTKEPNIIQLMHKRSFKMEYFHRLKVGI